MLPLLRLGIFLGAFSRIISVETDRSLIIILVDGVRRSYIGEEERFGFEKLKKYGVETEYVVPIFPSVSYPNWYTISTGKYAENHGFVGNYMYDKAHDDYFLGAPQLDPSRTYWWNQAEPIWVTAEKNGIPTGMYWWDGCQIPIFGITPTVCVPYKSYSSWPSVDRDTNSTLFEVLDLIEANQLRLAMVYYEPVDGYGHRSGPNSVARKDVLRRIDIILDGIQEEMERRNMFRKTNLVVLSDHGMTEISNKTDKLININEHVDVSDIHKMLEFHYVSMIWPEEGKETKLFNDLKNANIEGLKIYRREELPEELHIRNNARTAPIVLLTEYGHIINQLPDPEKILPYYPFGNLFIFIVPGVHGLNPYSNNSEDMRTIFYARGPSFMKNCTLNPLQMVDIYNMLCNSLQMSPLPNNGSFQRVENCLKL